MAPYKSMDTSELHVVNPDEQVPTARLFARGTFEGLALVRDRTIVAHNTQFTDLLGTGSAELSIDTVSARLDAESRQNFEKLLRRDPGEDDDDDRFVAAVGEEDYREFRIRRNVSGLTGQDQLLVVRDVTAPFRNEQELRRAKADLEQFAYVASHDLKSPLRGISNLASWIRDDLDEQFTEQTSEYFELLQGRITRMETLLQDLLDYSRAGRKKASVATVPVDELLEDVVDLVSPPAGFDVQVQAPHVEITTTPTPLRTCVQNLVQNVFKHHDKKEGRILVAAAIDVETGDLVIEVVDDGPGIAPKFHEKIFAVFETLRPRDEVEGSGIGLALVRRLVHEVGGQIEVESPLEDGRGTCFRMSWPLLTTNEKTYE